MIKEHNRMLQSWELSDAFWDRLEPLLTLPTRSTDRVYKRKIGGWRKPADLRKIFAGILYILRTGCMWKAVPKEYGALSSIHRYFQHWTEEGIWIRLWKKWLAEYDELEGISWTWQSLDGSMVKSPMGKESVGANPTDRGKKWSEKKSSRRRIWHPTFDRHMWS